jgi:hypothetical protein
MVWSRSVHTSTLRDVSEPLQDEEEVLDGLPVLPEEPAAVEGSADGGRALSVSVASPAQAAAVAVGGFVAGAAVVGLVHRRHAKRALSPGRRSRRVAPGERRRPVAELVQVVASRSLLVDVHLLGSSPQR